MDSSQSVSTAARRPHRSILHWMLIAAAVCVGALIAAFAFLAITLLVNLNGAQTNAESQSIVLIRRRAEIDIVRLCKAIDEYTILNGGRRPESLAFLVTQDLDGRSLLSDPSVLIDPWQRPYGYEAPTNDRDYRVFSLGKDGKPGGSGDNADIDNATIIAARSR